MLPPRMIHDRLRRRCRFFAVASTILLVVSLQYYHPAEERSLFMYVAAPFQLGTLILAPDLLLLTPIAKAG